MRLNKLMLVVILLLGVVFATVTTTLYLNGNVKIATNDGDFDVKFTKAVLDGTDVSSAVISSDGKTITFSTKDLIAVGDISKLDFEVTNNSTMYDAEVSIECTAGGAKKDYYEIAKEVTSPIVGKTSENGKVEAKLLKASEGDFSESFTCTLKATAKERTEKAEAPQIYYAYGDPLTAADRTTDYTTLTYLSGSKAGQQAKVFVKLEGTQKSVCMIRNERLECFKNNNVAEEQAHVREVFSDVTCSSSSAGVSCNSSDFYCYMYSDGGVNCKVYGMNLGCDVYSNGIVTCYY